MSLDQDTRRFGFREARFTERGLPSQRQGHQAARPRPPSDVPLCRAGDAGPACSGVMRRSCATSCGATSSAPRIIRSRGISSMPAMNWACWCWRRFPAGSTSGDSGLEGHRGRQRRPHGSRATGTIPRSFSGACASTSRTTITTSTRAPMRSRTSSTRAARPAASAIFQSSEFLEDVFTMNDFGFPLLPPNHPAI